MLPVSEKHRQVFSEQSALIEIDPALSDLPPLIAASQGILTFTHKEISFRFRTITIDEKPALGSNFSSATSLDLDVRQHMRGPGNRLLGPVATRHNLFDALFNFELAFIEPIKISTLAGVFILPISECAISRDRHPLA